MEELAVVGISEIVGRLPDLWRAMATLKSALRERRPDALVLVDYPDFNFRLARYAKRIGIPILYYITPQVWAWRSRRVGFLRSTLRRALVIFPFEETFLRERGVDAVFVGHPLASPPPPPSPRVAFLARHGMAADSEFVALLPGSRNSEVARNLPTLLEAAKHVAAKHPDVCILIPWADSLRSDPPRVPEGSVRFVRGEYRDVLGHAAAAAVASGTACLEAALLAVPTVVVYRLQPITYAIGRRLVKLPFVALPNVVLGRGALRELIQGDFTAQGVADALLGFLAEPRQGRARAEALRDELKEVLGGGDDAYERAAREVLKAVSRRVSE
jgi:lipid-A-disaccharide synthase